MAMFRPTTTLLTVVILSMDFVASAQVAPPLSRATDTPPTQLRMHAQRLFPQSRIDAIAHTPIPGLYEIISGQSILYMDATGRYVLIGELYDFTAKKNLTAERGLTLNTVRFSDLPFGSAIRLGPKDGTRQLAVFDDVDCPYCRKFHSEVLPALLKDGVTVHVFLYPLSGLHPEAEAKSKKIWCSDNRVAALEATMSGTPPESPSGDCPNPLHTIKALATTLGISGTPTLILDNNVRVEGFVDYDTLMARWQTRETTQRR